MSPGDATPPVDLPLDLTATLVLVRHGESVWVAEGRFQGRLDPSLSPLGERQADLVARRLAEHAADGGPPLPIPAGPPVAIWHSPLARAADTARRIGRAMGEGVPLVPSDDLTEIAQGDWEGLLHAEVSERWSDELAAWRRTPTRAHAPGGEPLLDAAERVRRGMGSIIPSLRDRRSGDGRSPDEVAATASRRLSPVPGYPTGADGRAADPWAVLVAHDGIFRLALMSLLGIPYERFWSFPFNLCSITVLALNDGRAALRAHNVSDHLAPQAVEARAALEASGDRRGAL